MKIITVSREFGSGGREIGKRMAEGLGFDYYDREILTEIARKCNVDENWAEFILQNNFPANAAITINRSFHMPSVINSKHFELLHQQTEVIKEIAQKGRDFVIVGRNADVLLSEYNPLNIFVCADMDSKVERCMARKSPDEKMTEKDIIKKIKLIDKNRQKTREVVSDSAWGDRHTYNITVNTTGWNIKSLSAVMVNFAEKWFEKTDK